MRNNAISAAVALAITTTSAHAEVWVGVEAPLAIATSDQQSSIFRPGFLPSAAIFFGRRAVAVGLRLRGGFLRDGAPPAADRADPSTGGLVSLTVAARVRLGGPWLELAAGGGITGTTLAPTFEVGGGWSFTGDGYELGPSARFVQVVSTDAMDAFGTAQLALVGLDVRWGKVPRHPPLRPPPPFVRAEPAPAVARVAIEGDRDRLVDRDASCVQDVESCPPPRGMEVLSDRIILDERVLFDVDRARVRSRGRDLLNTIVYLWELNPGWSRITVEGHADVRGSDDYNLALGELRAQHVRATMIELGAPAALIDAVGIGRARPRDLGSSEAAHARNRRVEFVIDRRMTP